MLKKIDFTDFVIAFEFHKKVDKSFSWDALQVIFDDLEFNKGELYVLNMDAICREFVESDPLNIARDYAIKIDAMGMDEIEQAVQEYLEDQEVWVGRTTSTFIFRNF